MAQDPTKMRNQPELTNSSGRTWLVVGGLTTVLLVILMIILGNEPGGEGAPLVILINVVAFAALVAVHLVVKVPKLKLRIMAVIFSLMVLISLIAVMMISANIADLAAETVRQGLD